MKLSVNNIFYSLLKFSVIHYITIIHFYYPLYVKYFSSVYLNHSKVCFGGGIVETTFFVMP